MTVPKDAPLTVSLVSMPGAHDGMSAVTFHVVFSDEPYRYSYRTLRDHTVRIAQDGVALAPSRVRRLELGSNRRWAVTVAPVSKAGLGMSIAATTDCAAAGAVCTEDGRMLSNAVSELIPGPPGLSVADARVHEGDGGLRGAHEPRGGAGGEPQQRLTRRAAALPDPGPGGTVAGLLPRPAAAAGPARLPAVAPAAGAGGRPGAVRVPGQPRVSGDLRRKTVRLRRAQGPAAAETRDR